MRLAPWREPGEHADIRHPPAGWPGLCQSICRLDPVGLHRYSGIRNDHCRYMGAEPRPRGQGSAVSRCGQLLGWAHARYRYLAKSPGKQTASPAFHRQSGHCIWPGHDRYQRLAARQGALGATRPAGMATVARKHADQYSRIIDPPSRRPDTLAALPASQVASGAGVQRS
ncbi:hypothetical protein D3C80_1427270 [compost metagenome]